MIVVTDHLLIGLVEVYWVGVRFPVTLKFIGLEVILVKSSAAPHMES
jgi:hypothetical protein